MKHIWLYLNKSDIETERLQCEQEGRNLDSLREEFDRVLGLDLEDPKNQPDAEALLDRTIQLPIKSDFPYNEPSDLDGIRAARPGNRPALSPLTLADSELENRVYGAWTGRCSGCLLGKPVEGWRRNRMWGYLKDTGRWPLNDFFRYDAANEETRKKYDLHPETCFADRVSFMPEDDDTNYTTTGLALMMRHSPGFTPTDVANFWMNEIPILHTCTAERVAYRNFVNLIPPPHSATWRNPYREWIGAQIRADFFGYAAAGNPELAAEFAWRDACISHVKNGIYGEMWAAAMTAAAFVSNDPISIIHAGLGQIPENCRLAVDVKRVLSWREEGLDYDATVSHLHGIWNEERAHDWCHTISNAMIVSIGLLWGEGDFGLSISRAVQPCFDTDCNGATVGSIMGAMLGRKSLPARWIDLMNDTLYTGVAGYHSVKLADIAKDSLKVIEKVAAGR